MRSVTRAPMFRFLAVMTVASAAGLQGWRTLFNNFAVEVVHLGGAEVGVIQSVREIPGLLAVLAVLLFVFFKEHRLSALSIMALGAGVGATGLFPSFAGLLFTTLLMSFGFHYYETTNQSQTLQYFGRESTPWVFGKQRSYAAATNIAVGGFIFAASHVLGYTGIYILLGGTIFCAGAWGFLQDPARHDLPPQRKKMVFRRRYGLFYFLTFMSGARRQIFVVFAVFLLVEKFGFSIREVTLLFVLNNGINYFLSPLIGKAVIRFGERRVLSLEYLGMIAVFTAYAFVESGLLAAGLYMIDHVFFNFALGIRTYFQKICDPRDIAPSMAVGFTINHIAAVVIPVAGGLLWTLDYRIPFLAAAGMSALSLVAAQRIRTPGRPSGRGAAVP